MRWVTLIGKNKNYNIKIAMMQMVASFCTQMKGGCALYDFNLFLFLLRYRATSSDDSGSITRMSSYEGFDK